MSSLTSPAIVFDPVAARANLARARGPVFWRCLEELSDSESFHQWLRTQHPQLAQTLAMDRRGFIKLLGASLALAGLAACSHPPQDEIVPYVHAPVGQIDGLPRFFASTLCRDGFGQGVLVESHMGRPTKIEGNPQHPASRGGTDIFAQACVLQLWDPDRSQSVMRNGSPATWDDFTTALFALTQKFDRNQGAGLRILTGAMTSPTLSAQLDAFAKKYPRAACHLHQPAGNDNRLSGAKMAFGKALAQRLHFDRAKIIVSLDMDFLLDAAAGVRYARDFAAMREVGDTQRTMSRLYVVEPTPSVTGAMADHRLPLESSRIERFACQLAKRLGLPVGDCGQTDAKHDAWIEAVSADLLAHRGDSLIVVGNAQSPWLHALGHAMNAALGNVGTTTSFSRPVQREFDGRSSVRDLVADMHVGAVDTLLILDGNPVYDTPADLQFQDALKHVPNLLHLGLYHDETGALAQWHVPQAHVLETWSDARAFDGTASIAQPLIAPLYAGHSAHEVMAALLNDDVRDGQALVRRQWQTQLQDDASWNAALQVGVIADSAFASVAPDVSDDFMRKQMLLSRPSDQDNTSAAPPLELLFRPDPTIGDGYWANNGWLQELPKPLTQLTWDNAALISPALAEKHAVRNGDMIQLRLRDRTLVVPAWLMPGQAKHSVTLHLGYGRTRAGHVGDFQGFDAYTLRESDAPWNADGLAISKTVAHYALAGTQHHFNMEGRDLLRVGSLAEFLANPHFATAQDDFPGTPPSLYADYPPGKYAWGMSIDLNACIGCKACTIACQSENNIPVVGKDQVQRGREMQWIRVDHYFEGGADNPRTYSQPVPCMMCEHAPCELVCPVGATVHDAEGLNVQVYNRCVGTRFCSNNCPYKVRRFNFLQYADKRAESLKAQRNPEVTVRRRGVMEKCTYCIQRIETAHIQADKDGRRIRDGEVITACQAVCPTRAIRFGDISDAQTSVAKAKGSPRNYAMLGELNTRPRTTYLARIRNPNPELKDDGA